MYVKLFSSILDSSIWSEDQPTRLVWITMLAMADEAGIVAAAVPGLSRRAGVSLDEARQALAVLSAPDAESRSPENEGRRIEAVDGGWRLLNYEKYREIRTNEQVQAARRMRKMRERQRQEGVTSDVTGANGGVTDTSPLPQAEAEASSEALQETAGAIAPLALPPLPEPTAEEPIGTWYGRVLKPILYVHKAASAPAQRENENRDISVLKAQLKSRPRHEIEDAVREAREQAEDGQLTGWIEPGQTFTLRALVAEPNGGIATYERFRHAAVKRRDLQEAS